MWEKIPVNHKVVLNLRRVTFKAETHYATNRCDTSPRQLAATNCDMWKLLSLRSVARIQTGLNSCDISQRQNKRKQLCHSVCTLLRQVAATKFKSTNEGASYIYFWSLFTFPLFQIRLRAPIKFLVAAAAQKRRLVAATKRVVAAMCRSDLSHSVSRPLVTSYSD